MAKQSFNDLGLGTKAKKLINKDGSFNVVRTGQPFSTVNMYQSLIKMPWYRFHLMTFGILLFINGLFAFSYYSIGIEYLNGVTSGDGKRDFLNCLFFSFQTFTTVGYGHISPKSDLISFLAAVEAITGLMVFAVITGLIYGRFAKPTAKLLYSENLLVSPYQDGLSYQFRLVNERKSVIMDIHARVLVSFSEKGKVRSYKPLELERSSVVLFPLNWTVVHPVTMESPLYGMSYEDLVKYDTEFVVVIKGYDDTFSQEVNSIRSYRYDEIIWGAKFEPMYNANEDGSTNLQIDKLNSYQLVKRFEEVLV
jgi:inward rectifier potassium channel